MWNLRNFWEHLFYRTPPDHCSWISLYLLRNLLFTLLLRKWSFKNLYYHFFSSKYVMLGRVNSKTFFSAVLEKFCAWNAKLAGLTSSSAFFLAATSNNVYLWYCNDTFMDINTESTEFQSNSLSPRHFRRWGAYVPTQEKKKIPQDSNWCLVPISDLNNLKGHNVI